MWEFQSKAETDERKLAGMEFKQDKMIGAVLHTSPERSMSFLQKDPDMTLIFQPKLSLGCKQILQIL